MLPNTIACSPRQTKSLAPFEPSWSRAVYHLYVIRAEDRDGMMNQLKKAGIGTGIHYPIPLHLQKAYAAMNYRPGRLSGYRTSSSGDRLSTDVSSVDRAATSEGG